MATQTNIQDIFNWLENSRAELMNKFIYRMIPNKRDAEDFFNDLFIILADKDFNKIRTIYDNNEMSQYLYVIIRNNLQSKNSDYLMTQLIGIDF